MRTKNAVEEYVEYLPTYLQKITKVQCSSTFSETKKKAMSLYRFSRCRGKTIMFSVHVETNVRCTPRDGE